MEAFERAVRDLCAVRGGQGIASQLADEVLLFGADLKAMEERRTAVEIGTRTGGMAVILATLFARVVTVDKTKVDDVALRSLGRPYGVDHVIVPLTGDSMQPTTATRVGDAVGGKVDVLFIDGSHHYQHVRADAVTYIPFVREGGVVAFHDISPGAARDEVRYLWRQLRIANPGLHFNEAVSVDGSCGIGWFRKEGAVHIPNAVRFVERKRPVDDLTVVVAAHNTSNYVALMYRTLQATAPGFAGPFVIVDDGSSDGLELVAEQLNELCAASEVRVFSPTERYGCEACLDEYVPQVETPYVILSHGDVEFLRAGWLEETADVLRAHECVMGQVFPGNQKWQPRLIPAYLATSVELWRRLDCTMAPGRGRKEDARHADPGTDPYVKAEAHECLEPMPAFIRRKFRHIGYSSDAPRFSARGRPASERVVLHQRRRRSIAYVEWRLAQMEGRPFGADGLIEPCLLSAELGEET